MQKLEDVYLKNKQGLFSLALSVTRNVSEAEDAVHNAIIRLAKRTSDVKGDYTAYVFAAVRNSAIDMIRKSKRRNEAVTDIFDDSQVSSHELPNKGIITEERNKLIREQLASLNEKQREVVILKLYSGLTFEQIAETLDEPLSTVSSRYARTLKSLKNSMEALV